MQKFNYTHRSALPKLVSILIIISVLVLLQFSFITKPNFNSLAFSYSAEFYQKVESLKQASLGYKNGAVAENQLKDVLNETRLAYKKIEFLYEYRYSNFVEEHINGAPLFHIERNESGAYVIDPEGLQTIDELVYSDELKENKNELYSLCQKLENETKIISNSFTQKNFKQVEIIEAIRLELVRVFAMGITGFDTPGSLHAIEEARVSIGSMQEFLNIVSTPEQKEKVDRLFNESLKLVSDQSNFNDFDRLKFLRDIVEPLYKQLYFIQESVSDDRIVKIKSGWNSNSQSIFSDDFLNPYQYTELTEAKNSDELKSLGELFFYDSSLSGNGKFSCASCHNPNLAYTDGNAKSLSSVEGKTVQRNAPTLLNAVYSDRFFYDLRAFSLEQQAEHVIYNHMEFNTNYDAILAKINSNDKYTQLLKNVFGHTSINREEYSSALASYVMSLRSYNSSFDKYVRGETDNIADEVKLGFNVFMGKANCGTCHFAPTFAGLVPPFYTKNESEILGVLANPKSDNPQLDTDFGRNHNNLISEKAWIYNRSFKTSTVRNIENSGPYFHNGAYTSLEQVIEFYNNGGGLGYGLDVPNQTLSGDSLHLTDAEQKALIAFMKSLSDNPFIKK